MAEELTRGDTVYWRHAWVDADGQPLDLSDSVLTWTTKREVNQDSTIIDDTVDLLIQHRLEIDANGITTFQYGFMVGGTHPLLGTEHTAVADGVVTQRLSAADSTTLPLGPLIYDLQLERFVSTKPNDADTTTHERGLPIMVLGDVTRRRTTTA